MSALVGYSDYGRIATVRTTSSVSDINKICILTYLQRCLTASKNIPHIFAVPSAKSATLSANVIEVVGAHLN
jgi:hypothetical protein